MIPENIIILNYSLNIKCGNLAANHTINHRLIYWPRYYIKWGIWGEHDCDRRSPFLRCRMMKLVM